MKTLDEMRDRGFLNAAQHAEIGAWVASAKSPERILEMPEALWRALSLASVLLGVDHELRAEPQYDREPSHDP